MQEYFATSLSQGNGRCDKFALREIILRDVYRGPSQFSHHSQTAFQQRHASILRPAHMDPSNDLHANYQKSDHKTAAGQKDKIIC